LPPPRRRERAAALVVAVTGSFLMPFMGASISVALPAIGQEFDLGALALSWLATGYLLATAIFLVPFGRLADIYGRNRMYLFGNIVYTIASAGCALAPSASLLLAARVLQGLGAAMMVGLSMALIASVFAPGERGRVLGLTVAAVYLGLSVGPFVGGLLTHGFGWRSLFWTSVPLGLGISLLSLFLLAREQVPAQREPFDLPGALLYGLALLLLMLGLGQMPSLPGGGLVLAGVLGLGLFGRWAARCQHPVLDLTLFRTNRVFLFSSLAALTNYAATFAISFLLSLYLQSVGGYDPRQAGLILVTQPAVQSLLSPLAGRLSDRLEPRLVASAGMACTVVGLVLLAGLGETPDLPYLTGCLLLLGLGFALFSSPNTNAVLGSVDRRSFGIASGILATMRLLGQMLSMGVATLMLALILGGAPVSAAVRAPFVLTMRLTFLLLAACCLLGVFASLARGSVHQPPAAGPARP